MLSSSSSSRNEYIPPESSTLPVKLSNEPRKYRGTADSLAQHVVALNSLQLGKHLLEFEGFEVFMRERLFSRKLSGLTSPNKYEDTDIYGDSQ